MAVVNDSAPGRSDIVVGATSGAGDGRAFAPRFLAVLCFGLTDLRFTFLTRFLLAFFILLGITSLESLSVI